MKRKYRVVLPVDLGDGQVHNFGQVVELDPAAAEPFSHALVDIAAEQAAAKTEE